MVCVRGKRGGKGVLLPLAFERVREQEINKGKSLVLFFSLARCPWTFVGQSPRLLLASRPALVFCVLLCGIADKFLANRCSFFVRSEEQYCWGFSHRSGAGGTVADICILTDACSGTPPPSFPSSGLYADTVRG